ncbi:hypothetical protein C8A05DRAFT_33292 [Staphylotrichum tortipilum]|uniref:Rhodopsin domain-containing protein n=1 Tax=Staphylotrichum tortipilum TaxID=2831512 RepID=A0AAN6MN95_9PEZI|nr:hypothetical protein C8A05DRAFT_33292 [Staphylotrichum longicolle]
MGDSTTASNQMLVWPGIPLHPARSLQPDIVACAVLTLLISTLFVGLRFYTRGRVNHVLNASDWCILPALLCAAGVTASSLEQMAHGAGRHVWENDPYSLPGFERAAWYGILFYNLSLTLSRVSILLLYQRIFTYSWIKRTIQIVLILVILIGVWLVVSVFTACIPLQAFWDWSLYFKTHVYCHPVNLWWGNAALHITSDLVVMALPMPVLSSLNLPRRQKYAIVGVFALGFFVCVISIVRLVALIDATQNPSLDGIYTSANMIFWTTVEVNSAVSCACIMTLKPLIQRAFPRLLSPSKGHRDPPNLQWITPVNTITTTTTTTTTTIPETTSSTPSSPTNPPLARTRSNTSTKPHRASNPPISLTTLPYLPEHYHHHHEKEYLDSPRECASSRYYHGLIHSRSGDTYLESDLDHDLDLEVQRTAGGNSSCETVAETESTGVGSVVGAMGDLEGGGELRAPPRAHF